ncbi:hypothetical protein GH714_005153 [Hevea brasiliensis]|uniref:TOD1/MUCI70 glycosyltransferase-like domain-containing protein n=1 Tax=Hevea brasiliensis TaxID=3981 RepID=A0A6A6LZ66_HEVBR|nr:hypothetical protein GH714_005153 [Hevea brasiliensis]
MSMGALHGGKLAMERLTDYHQARADAASLNAAESELKVLLEEEQPDFKKLQSAVAKLEMSGKEAVAVGILESAVKKARMEEKPQEAYEIEMLLVEMLIYKGDYDKALKCECLSHEEISDARRPLYKGFSLSFVYNSDRMTMESCNGVAVVSAIFNNHDKIRQPKTLGSKTLDNVCFFMFVDDITLKELNHHQLISRESFQYSVGVWRILKVSSTHLYENPAMNGVIPKYLVHRLFPNSKFSIWIDAKLQLMVDPLLLIHTLVVSKKVDMAISKHPYFTHTMEEALATARWRKWWDIDALRLQMETYCENGLEPWTPTKLPYPSGKQDS